MLSVNRVLAKGIRVVAGASRIQAPVLFLQPTSVLGKSFVRSFSSLKPVIVEPLENLGDNIATATLVSWHKVAGEAVEEDDVVAIIETDKVTMDIRARVAGKFVEGLAEVQSEVIVGSPLYKIQPL